MTHLNQQVLICIKRNIQREYESVWVRDGTLLFRGRDWQIQPIQFRDYRTWVGGQWNTIMAGVYAFNRHIRIFCYNSLFLYTFGQYAYEYTYLYT